MEANRSKRRSHKPRRRARAASDRGQMLVQRLTNEARLKNLLERRERKDLRDAVEQLKHELGILAMSPKLRIVAVRRRQGAVSRRQTATQDLFDACTEVRRRVKLRFRGPKHALLRRAFGEGLPASAAKPETTLRFAQQILRSAPEHMESLRVVRVGPPTLRRIETLCEKLRNSSAERFEWRTAQQQLTENLAQVVERVERLCDSIEQIIGEVPGTHVDPR